MSKGPCSPEYLQVLHGTWSPCLPLCSARPIINAGRAARVLPIARGTAAGVGCQGAHASARTQGKEPEGHRRVLKEKRVPGPTAVRVKTDVPTLWLPTAGSHSNTATKTFPAQKATSESFPCPPRSLFPAKTRFTANKQQEISIPEVHTPVSTFSNPWPGQRAQGRCPLRGFLPHPRVRRPRDAAQPTHHGDSRRGRASTGSGCLGTEVGTRGLLSKLQKLISFAEKQAPRHPSTHSSQWKPRGDSIQAGSETLGEGKT